MSLRETDMAYQEHRGSEAPPPPSHLRTPQVLLAATSPEYDWD